MKAKLRSLRKKIKRPRLVVGIVAACVPIIALIIAIIGGYLFHWSGTGVSQKTLWDWLNLLGVLAIPVVVGFGVAWFTMQQNKVADAENKDNQRETALQNYIDKISELLLHEHLGESPGNPQVESIARARTVTALRILDPVRRGSLIQFLSQAGILAKCIKIELNGMELRGANLNRVNLSNINLSGANLSGANLSGANLSGANLIYADLNGGHLSDANLTCTVLYRANLSGADLNHADLSGAFLRQADLSGANLTNAQVTTEQLDQVRSLKGATKRDWSNIAK